MNNAYSEGKTASRQGGSALSCPYPKGTPERTEWNEGFVQGCYEIEQPKKQQHPLIRFIKKITGVS